MTTLATFQAWSNRLVALIRATLSRAVVRLVDPATLAQVVQVELFAGEVREVEHFEPYGWTSHPFAGSEAVVGFMQANRDHGIALVVGDRRYRLVGLEEGEVAVFDDLGQVVHLKRGGVLVSSPTTVEIEAPTVSVLGDLEVSGGVEVVGDVVAGGDLEDGTGTVQAFRDAYNAHTHPGDSGGTTGPPSPTV